MRRAGEGINPDATEVRDGQRSNKICAGVFKPELAALLRWEADDSTVTSPHQVPRLFKLFTRAVSSGWRGRFAHSDLVP